MTIYVPYTYVITHKTSGRRYYGVRYANRKRDTANPSDLWSSYFTSSKVIKNILDKEGPEAFTYEVRKTFTNKLDAITWEHKVLRRLNVKENSVWFNQTHSSDKYYSRGHSEEVRKKIGLASATRIHSKETIQRRAASRSRKWLIILPDQTEEVITNLNAYCRDNGLMQGSMVDVASGRQRTHRNYSCKRLS